MSNNNDKKKGFRIARLFESNRFVLVFSVFTAIVLWFVMAFNNTENRARVIYDVEIDATLSDEAIEQGYEIFEQSDAKARVSVTGNSIVVNQLTNTDIKVSAALASNIIRAGEYTLNLSASKNNSNLTDFEVETIDPGSVILFVDKSQKKTFKIENAIDYKAADGYYASRPAISETEITLTGPETEVSKIERVAVEESYSEPLTAPQKFTKAYTFYDKDGGVISTAEMKHVDCSSTEATVVIDVFVREELPVTVSYSNLTEGIDLSNIVSVDPKTLVIGDYADEAVDEISLTPINMSEVNLKNTTFTADFILPKNAVNISGEKQATVRFDLSGYEESGFTVRDFVLINQASGQSAKVDTAWINVTLVGPKDQLKKIKASELYGEVDLSGAPKSAETAGYEAPVKIVLNSQYGAWVYGDYSVYVSMEKSS